MNILHVTYGFNTFDQSELFRLVQLRLFSESAADIVKIFDLIEFYDLGSRAIQNQYKSSRALTYFDLHSLVPETLNIRRLQARNLVHQRVDSM
jgi:hypothetical protein